MTTVVVSPYRTVRFFDGGGHFWVYLQYVHALRQAGCEVYWFERFRDDEAGPFRSKLPRLLERLSRFGLEGRVILCTSTRQGRHDYVGASRAEAERVFARADLLLNFHYALDPELLALFRRTALVDIDPGQLQAWMTAGQLAVAKHDVHFTIGESVGSDRPWVHIRPPVCLDLWPYRFDPTAETFTTVTSWWNGWVPELVDGHLVVHDNTKRRAYLAFADLPRLTPQPLELAIFLTPQDAADRALLERSGWQVRHSLQVSSTPESYRRYIQSSRGELTCVKPSYAQQATAWVSDRSVCYLASGKPVVMQDTGHGTSVPFGEGLLSFGSPAEAAEALAKVNADYQRHCVAARDLAATYFDGRKTAERILSVALA